MKLCRFKNAEGETRVGRAVNDESVADLSAGGVESITELLEDDKAVARVEALADLPKMAG